MRGKPHPKVLVIGAGPAGLSAALTLNRRGVPVEIVERGDQPGTHSYALALHPRSAAMLDKWDLLDGLRRDSLQVRELVFYDRDGPRATLDLTKVPGQEAGLLVVGQNHLEKALVGALESAEVPIHWNCRMATLEQSEEQVEVTLQTLIETMSGYAMARLELQVEEEFSKRVDYLIGADGHLSIVRRRCGIDFPRVAPTQSFAVFEFKSDFDPGQKAHIVLSEAGTSVLWPLPGGYCRWGFEIEEAAAETFSRDKDRLFMQVGNHGYHVLESKILEEMLAERAPWFNGSVEQFRWRMLVRFEKRLAPRFGQGRVWLAGDSVHLTGPVGMQSMNIGLKEGQLLGNALADVVQGKAAATVLDAYQDGRIAEWRKLMGLSNALQNRPDTNDFLAGHLDQVLGCLPACGDSLAAFAEALGADLVPV